MAVTIGGVTIDTLQAQPFGYEETRTKGGLTARQWEIQGLVTGAEWTSLLGVYNAWRNAKITEDPAEISKVVGTTVAFSGTGFGSETWSNIACWFSSAPSGENVGNFVSVNLVLVDASQAIQVLIKEKEDEKKLEEGEIDYGTITIGGVTITLTKDPDVFLETPQLELTAAGNHYVTGPKFPIYGKDIQGTIPATSKAALMSWYATAVATTPSAGSYYPSSPPLITGGVYKTVGGSQVLHYEVSLSVTLVR